MDHVLSYVKETINFIRSRGLNQRQFSSLLSEMEIGYQTLIYYAEVRWLFCYKVLKRFWEIRNEIKIFLEIKNKSIEELKNINWLQDLAFVTDITGYLNELNLKLQGRNNPSWIVLKLLN